MSLLPLNWPDFDPLRKRDPGHWVLRAECSSGLVVIHDILKVASYDEQRCNFSVAGDGMIQLREK